MNTKHTPGPWRVSQGGKFVQLRIPGTVANVCEMSPLNGDDGHCAEPLPLPSALMEARAERDANARLIASAPELLEALQYFAQCSAVRDIVQGNTELATAVFMARQAILKATGGKE